MRITYVTEDTELWGGIGVVFQHLELLAEAGHDVFLTTPTSGPDWYPLKVPVHTIERLDSSLIPPADIIVATSWKTIKPVVESKKGIAVHLCQGYEAANKEYLSIKGEIDETYSRITPKLTISRHLEKLLTERFNAETYYIGQMLNREIFFPQEGSRSQERRDRFIVLVVGIFEADVKNIRTALKGISIAQSKLPVPLKLIRVSPFPLSKSEVEIREPEVYHFRVPYQRMGEIYRDADVLISASKEAEGFGLPVLEAMACGIPTILTRIPSYLGLDEPQDYALFVDSEPGALSEAIQKLCRDKKLKLGLSKRGLSVAEKFTGKALLKRLINAFERIISHA